MRGLGPSRAVRGEWSPGRLRGSWVHGDPRSDGPGDLLKIPPVFSPSAHPKNNITPPLPSVNNSSRLPPFITIAQIQLLKERLS